MSIDPNDILMGGGVPSAKFDAPGVTVGGRIIAPARAYQEREYVKDAPGTGALKFYDSGDPIMGLSVDVQTTDRSLGHDDDGLRRIYISGKRMKTAVSAAVRAAGAPGLEVGGEITVTYTHQEDPTDKRSAKHYTARYVPAASAAFMAETTPAPSTPAPAPAPAPSTPAGGVDQAAIAAAMANLDPAVLAAIQASQK